MKNEIKLEKMHVAMLSGGKDSLYMFAHIMANIDKYPLDAKNRRNKPRKHKRQ